MSEATLSVRELPHSDIEPLTNYWLSANNAFLLGMGVDIAKMPTKKEWINMLEEQLKSSMEHKKSYCIIWEMNGKAVGHSNINKIIAGQEAFMHLHLWETGQRKKGIGVSFIKMTLPYFFNTFQLQKLYCEPYALNEAPNRVLQKAGFDFVKKYITTPGWINFEQEVNLWEMSLGKYKLIQ